MWHVDFNHITQFATAACIAVWTLIGGVTGGRRVVGWLVRKYEDRQAQEVRDRVADAREAKARETRRQKEHDDSLSDLRNQNEKLWEQNAQLWKRVDELQNRMTGIQHDVGEVQIEAGRAHQKADEAKRFVQPINQIIQSAIEENPK